MTMIHVFTARKIEKKQVIVQVEGLPRGLESDKASLGMHEIL